MLDVLLARPNIWRPRGLTKLSSSSILRTSFRGSPCRTMTDTHPLRTLTKWILPSARSSKAWRRMSEFSLVMFWETKILWPGAKPMCFASTNFCRTNFPKKSRYATGEARPTTKMPFVVRLLLASLLNPRASTYTRFSCERLQPTAPAILSTIVRYSASVSVPSNGTLRNTRSLALSLRCNPSFNHWISSSTLTSLAELPATPCFATSISVLT